MIFDSIKSNNNKRYKRIRKENQKHDSTDIAKATT